MNIEINILIINFELMLFDFNKINLEKIKSFTLVKDKSYNEQICYYLRRLTEVSEMILPYKTLTYAIVKEYSDVVIVNLIDNNDINKYNKNNLIYINKAHI